MTRLSPKRNALSLVELVMVMAAASVIASLAVMLTTSMVRQQSATSRQLATHRGILRMRTDFSTDVRDSTSTEVDSDSAQLTKKNGEVVSWTRDRDWVVRETIDGGTTRREHYDVLGGAGMVFSELQNDFGQFVVVEIEAARDVVDASSMDARHPTGSLGARILAEVGRDHRWRLSGLQGAVSDE